MSERQVIVGCNAAALFERGMTINLESGTSVMCIAHVDRNLGVLHLVPVRRAGMWRRFVLWLKGLLD